jgi:hypothetical protein
MLGIIPALVCFIFGVTAVPGISKTGLVMGGWASGAFLTYVLRLFVLNRDCPCNPEHRSQFQSSANLASKNEVRYESYTASAIGIFHNCNVLRNGNAG